MVPDLFGNQKDLERMMDDGAPATVALDVVTRLARLVAKVLEREVAGGMTVRQFRVLTRLVQGDERISQLAARAGVGAASMSEVIDTLVTRGWVERAEDPADRRCKTLQPTAEGLQAHTTAEQALHRAFTDLLAPLPDGEQAAITRGLRALQQVLDRRWAALRERQRT